MKILLLMNMYPPHSDGGYPLLCQETVKALEERGHEILVLTSHRGLSGKHAIEGNVWRVFDYCPDNVRNELSSASPVDLWRWYRREWSELRTLQRALDNFKPHAIFVWATKGMSYSLAMRLLREPLPTFAYVCGYWLADHNNFAHRRKQYAFWQWGNADGLPAIGKRLLGRLLEYGGIPLKFQPLLFDRLAFNSEEVIAALASPASKSPPVRIYDSAPLENFRTIRPANIDRPRRILFVGRIHPSKDPITLVKACALLQAESETVDLELTLTGWQHDPAYFEALRHAISVAPHPEGIHVRNPVQFDAMPSLFAAHDILAVPSQVDPLPRVAAEGMAAGLPIVVSDHAGISRLLNDRQEALIFPAGDPYALASCLGELMKNRELALSLSRRGRARALEYFSTRRMVDEIEAFLQEGVENFRSEPLQQKRLGTEIQA
jgi:glycogen(starch) synthase